MNELVRMQYLDAMGIDSFVPRMILPAAPLCVACELPVSLVDYEPAAEFIDPLEQEVSQPATPSPKTTAIVKQLLASGEASPTSATTSRPAVSSGLTLQALLAAKPKKQLRFVLTVWQLANGVVFIDSKEPKAALPTSALLGNVVKGLYPAESIPKPDSINWPLLESPIALDNALHEAREMTHAFLASRFEVITPKLLIVMGRVASDMVITAPQSDSGSMAFGESASPSHLPCAAVYLPSLAELLREPTLKYVIWPAVKAAEKAL